MRLIRRPSPGLAGVLALLAVSLVVTGLWVTHPPPDAPRYIGQGASTPHRGGTLIFQHDTNVRTLDPHIAFDELSGMALRLMGDGLLDYDESNQLVPSLAAEMPKASDGGKRFRFRLRRGVLFHTGEELTAKDVVYSMHRLLDPDVPSPGASYYAQIEGVAAYRSGEAKQIRGIRALSRYEVEFHLSEPNQTFLAAIAMPFAYPVPDGYYERPDIDAATQPTGVGPFKLVSWERGVRLTFTRHTDYFRAGLPHVDHMVYLENLNRSVAAMRFRNGDLDAIHRFNPADYLYFTQSKAWRPYLLKTSQVNLWGVVMNNEVPPFDNVHVRRAVAFAVDRDGWNRARGGRLRITGQAIPAGLPGYDPELPEAQYTDLSRAKEEMRLAGLPDGYPEPIELWVSDGEANRTFATLAQADLAKIGLKLTIKEVSFATYLEETGKPKQASMLIGGWNMDFPDAANFLDSLFHSNSARAANSSNRAFHRDPAVDALLDEARITLAPARRASLYRQASAILCESAPWAFMWSDYKVEVVQPYVRGYRINPVFSQDYRFVWLDLPKVAAPKKPPFKATTPATGWGLPFLRSRSHAEVRR